MSVYNESLTRGSVAGGLVRFAIPVLLSSILQMVYSTTDMLIVGRFAGTADVSGVSTGSMIMGLVTMTMAGLVMGVTVLIGHRAGARDEEGLREAAGTAIVFFALFAAGMMIPMLIFNHALVTVMQTPDAAVEKARAYLLICTVGTPFIVGYNLMGSMMRGFGDSKTPLLVVAVSCVINIAVDYVLIRYLAMGAAGAAIATVAAQAISLVFSGHHVLTRTFGFRLRMRDIRLRGPVLRAMLRVSIPQAGQELLVHLSFLLLTGIANRMGLEQSAAAGIGEKIIIYLMMPSTALAAAVATMSSHNLGAGQRDRAEKTLWVGVAIAFAFGVAMHILARLFGQQMASLFIEDEAVIRHTDLYLSTYTLDCMFTALVFPANSYLASCGYPLFAMGHTLAASLLVRVPIMLWMSRLPGVTMRHIGIAAPMSSLASAILCVLFLFLYVRRKDRLRAPKT